jgi:hypothetical protein
MEEISSLAKESLRFLIEDRYFVITKDENHSGGFVLVMLSQNLRIDLETYRGEVYAYLSTPHAVGGRVHLYNLLEYLHRKDLKKPDFHFFRNIADPVERYQLQLDVIAKFLKNDFSDIESFYGPKANENMVNLNKYLKTRYPHLYA